MSFQLNIEQVQALRILAQAFDYADQVALTERIDVSPFKPRTIEDARKVVAEIDAMVSNPILTQSTDLPVMVCEEGNWLPQSNGWDSNMGHDLMERFSGPIDPDSGDPRRFGGNLVIHVPTSELGILQELSPGDCDCGSTHSTECISHWCAHASELQAQFTESMLFVAQDQAGMDGNIVLGAFTPLRLDTDTLRYEDPYGDDGQSIGALMAALTYRVLPPPMEPPATPSSVALCTVDSPAIDLNW